MKIIINYFDDITRQMRSFRPEIEFDSQASVDKFVSDFFKELFKISVSIDED